ncbi:bifunctional MT-A70-like/S-adenosyl-L-methionine-dependent methyltransferase superfamily [Babesia duncani]|uniref:Bifunctional MT-A70-like/S-adenosyl-L-methionine-dependent methyltransferase superfamily n=1 Tax=Babesia duncani TaxID=323732 RepID=A0AAD9PGF0_9APIC|nr:bifunctional MT-A70-like/S-adenosyl-L-methionine-dependent methyltransferase superfamily [Babesia duncani]KAK2194840.1 bifunctional MT-A70-like/S-adenosyl-L-methionine-dependent methyltransferase superfamily [Babesia duncani]KAK2196016.1 bifunctional MT-A70-like/S-adenosyl-L-methionine-dependent methyltransferase superfamily [Babesia duncani]
MSSKPSGNSKININITEEDFPWNSFELTCCIAKVLLQLYDKSNKSKVFPISSRVILHVLKRNFNSCNRVRLLRLATVTMLEKILNHLANTASEKHTTKRSGDKYYSFMVYEPCCTVSKINDTVYVVDIHSDILKKALRKNTKKRVQAESTIPTNNETSSIDVDVNDTLFAVLNNPTAIQKIRQAEFQTRNGSIIRDICEFGTRQECMYKNPLSFFCPKVHFRRIILPHTNISLGDCSYLDTCRHIETCRFVHYEVEDEKMGIKPLKQVDKTDGAQWISCDVRKLDFSIFNPYIAVVMADPPWDIHMDLPYGTMKDSEMKNLKIQDIQSEGLLFLWVTGRTLEVGKECMELWGYRLIDEILWIKTNQLQRVIRTGRTGHWINHSKEHCLIGIKGTPNINRYIDCDVLVSEVRETSRKPDEIYRIIERIAPGSLKLEIFGRGHNIRNNWITLGNELDGYKLSHSIIKKRYEAGLNNCK